MRLKRTTHTPEYVVWRNMHIRCEQPNSKSYPHYGGRGIRVHPVFSSFDAFVDHVGLRPPGMSLDRIDNNGDYAPGNVRWATVRQQRRNRSDNLWITHDGRTLTLTDWCAETGIPRGTLWRRYHIANKRPPELFRPVMTASEIGIMGAARRWSGV